MATRPRFRPTAINAMLSWGKEDPIDLHPDLLPHGMADRLAPPLSIGIDEMSITLQ